METAILIELRVDTNWKTWKTREFKKLSKPHGKLRGIFYFCGKTWKIQGNVKYVTSSMQMYFIEFFSLVFLRERF